VAEPVTPTKAPAPPAARVEGSAAAWRAAAAAEAAAARARDVAAAFAGLPRVRPRWTHNYMKILIRAAPRAPRAAARVVPTLPPHKALHRLRKNARFLAF
jgi:hypothetical protein